MEKIYHVSLLRSTFSHVVEIPGFCFLNPVKTVIKKLTKVFKQKLSP